MPTMANIVIKKSDGTTDVTYTAVAGSAGDGTPALFRNKTVGTTVAEQPTLLVSARDNGSRTARRVDTSFSWPLVATDAGGNKVVIGRASGSTTFLAPLNQPSADIKEQAYQFGNLIGSALVKACFDEGFAPRG